MVMENILIGHLEKIQETATKSDLTEDMKNIDMLYLVGTMNSIRNKS